MKVTKSFERTRVIDGVTEILGEFRYVKSEFHNVKSQLRHGDIVFLAASIPCPIEKTESEIFMKSCALLLGMLLLGVNLIGCGGGETTPPTAEFTDEQKAAIAAEDAAVAADEMGGGMPPVKKAKKPK